MSAKPNEGNPEDAGGTNANSTPSESQSQPLEANFSEVVANLQRKIDAQQGEINALKGGKDGALDRIEKNQKDTFARIAKYLDVDVEVVRKAQRELALDDLVSERLNNPQPAQPIAGTVAKQGASAELQVIDQMLDLPANDARVTDLKLKYAGNPVEYGKAALALRGSFNQSSPSPAEQLPPSGGSAPRKSEKTPAQLEADYQAEIGKIAQTMRGDQKLKAITDLKARYREAGLEKY
jgi:hypothetical protein